MLNSILKLLFLVGLLLSTAWLVTTWSLAEPNWEPIITTLATLATLIGLEFTGPTTAPEQAEVKSLGILTNEQLYNLILLHQTNVISEITSIMWRFFYNAQAKRQAITEDQLEEVKRLVWKMILRRRELLRVFQTPTGRLDELMAHTYDKEFEHDYEAMKQIILAKKPLFDRAEAVQERIEEIQLFLRGRIDEMISMSQKSKF